MAGNKVEINKIGNNINALRSTYIKQDAPPPQEQKKSDKIEISDEARNLQSQNVSAQDFSVIKDRIKSDFYSRPEVMSKVADEILKSLS